ncbi:MAG: 2Fe-2S iron-sulfur cluster-binding protein [Paludibaculum sp.]
MHRRLTVIVDGRPVQVESGTTVAAALWNAGVTAFRHSVTGRGAGSVVRDGYLLCSAG